MSGSQGALFWLPALPESGILANALCELARANGQPSIEHFREHAWQTLPADVGRLRAACDTVAQRAGEFRVRIGGDLFVLARLALQAGPCGFQVQMSSRPAEDVERVAATLGATLGTLPRPDGGATFFCLPEMGAALQPPASARLRGPWLLWVVDTEMEADGWLKRMTRFIRTGSPDPATARRRLPEGPGRPGWADATAEAGHAGGTSPAGAPVGGPPKAIASPAAVPSFMLGQRKPDDPGRDAREALAAAPCATPRLPFPELSIDNYAALSVDIELTGATAEVLGRHGLSSHAALQALHAEQALRMSADLDTRRRFDERRDHFRQFARSVRPIETFAALAAAAPQLEGIDVDATGALDWQKLGSAILPFQRNMQAAIAPVRVGADAPLPRSPHMAATEELSPDAFGEDVLPFGKHPGLAPSPASRVIPAEPGTEETLQIPPPGPSPATVDTTADPITLERYAAISAELAAGEQREALARLGITREVWVTAMVDMAARFKAEPGLEERYRTLMRGLLGIRRPT